ncbi:MAG: glycosyltransferase [Deltaproteobacteria bacterium]|nr:glycosyltransferase [Deltaproteobacteria bacterium]
MHIGILTDFPTQSVQSGPAIHTRFLADRMRARGHEITLMGTDTTMVEEHRGPERLHVFRSFGYPTHPRVRLALPWPPERVLHPPRVDLIHGQTQTHMIHYANWMRRLFRIPTLHTYIVDLPTAAHVVLSDTLYNWKPARDWAYNTASGKLELSWVDMYNGSDVLIVQNRFHAEHWKERGVTSLIRVVGRPLDPARFDVPRVRDPFPEHFRKGRRLLVACRHDREKDLHVLIRIFGHRIAPVDPDVTLTLVGNGHYQDRLIKAAEATGYGDRIWFPGEVRHDQLAHWYRSADVFVYASISETFGNVINEALWCGLPVVALDDRLGVAHQVRDGHNGLLIQPGRRDTEGLFARAILDLFRHPEVRGRFGANAARLSREHTHPDAVVRRLEGIYEEAREHCLEHVRSALIEEPRSHQLAALLPALGTWTRYTSMLLGLAHVATRMTPRSKAPVQESVRRPPPPRRRVSEEAPASHLGIRS